MISEQFNDFAALVGIQQLVNRFGAWNLLVAAVLVTVVALAADYGRMIRLRQKMVSFLNAKGD
jgi:uncharacterized membrane protein